MPGMLGKSRFCRRLHRLTDFVLTLFFYLGQKRKDMTGAATYRPDSFPAPVCDNIRLSRPKLLKGRPFGASTPLCEGIFMVCGYRY